MKLILGLFTTSLLLSACASITQKFDSSRAQSVRKVAIVAVEIQQAKPTDTLGLSSFKNLKDGNDGDSALMQSMAKNVANQFASQLQKKTNWQVLPIDQMMKNPAYSSKVAAATSGARMVSVASNDLEAIYLKDTLDTLTFRKMSVAERAQLAKELKVDAVAELMILNKIDQSAFSIGHLTGDADFAYVGSASFQLYGLDSEEPIWRSQNITGDKTKSSGELPEKMPKLEKLSKLGEEASTSATSKLAEGYPL